MARIPNWSAYAGDNNAAAPNGFPEGLAASLYNNGLREMMSQIKKSSLRRMFSGPLKEFTPMIGATAYGVGAALRGGKKLLWSGTYDSGGTSGRWHLVGKYDAAFSGGIPYWWTSVDLKNWYNLSPPAVASDLWAIGASDLHCIAVGENGAIYESANLNGGAITDRSPGVTGEFTIAEYHAVTAGSAGYWFVAGPNGANTHLYFRTRAAGAFTNCSLAAITGATPYAFTVVTDSAGNRFSVVGTTGAKIWYRAWSGTTFTDGAFTSVDLSGVIGGGTVVSGLQQIGDYLIVTTSTGAIASISLANPLSWTATLRRSADGTARVVGLYNDGSDSAIMVSATGSTGATNNNPDVLTCRMEDSWAEELHWSGIHEASPTTEYVEAIGIREGKQIAYLTRTKIHVGGCV